MDKSFLSNISKINKDERNDQKIKGIEANFNNLNLGNSSGDIYYNNKSFIPKSDNNILNNINLNNINLNRSQSNNIRNINLFSNQNNFNSNNKII